MENKLQYEEVEKTLVNELSKTTLNKDRLSSISKSIAALRQTGFQVIDWSIFGQPPFEKFVVDTHLPFEQINSFSEMFPHKDFKEIFILRKGIPPMPNFYNVKFTIENR